MPDSHHQHPPALDAIIAVTDAAVFFRDMLDRAVAPLGITGGQYTILRILRRAGSAGANRAEILRQVTDKKADLTRQLDGLVRLGFVTRSRPVSDRRVVISTITPQGAAALEHLNPLFHSMLARLEPALAPAEWQSLANLCRALMAGDVSR
jgi:DNA-binding MarR family transcriptional regulator